MHPEMSSQRGVKKWSSHWSSPPSRSCLVNGFIKHYSPAEPLLSIRHDVLPFLMNLSQILSTTKCMWLFPFYQWESWCSEEWPTFPTPHNYHRLPNVHSTTSARAGLDKQSTSRESDPCFQWENPGLSQSGQSILLAMGLVQKWASIWIKKVQGKIFCSVNIIFTL